MMIADKFPHNVILARNTLFVWLLFAGLYFFFKNSQDTSIYSTYLTLIGEVGLDFVAAVLIIGFWRKSEKPAKNIFLVFFVSFIFAIVADAIYNIALNVFNYNYINPVINLFFEIPFALFLLVQFDGWLSILFLNQNANDKNKTFTYLPYAILFIITVDIFIFCVRMKIDYHSLMGIFQIIDSTLEVAGFALATICLTRASTSLIRFMGIGYLMIVSSDFIIRYYVISGLIPYLNSFEITRVLGLLLICIGFIISKNEKLDGLFQLQPISSLQSQICIWSLILWLSLISIFIILDYTFFQQYGRNIQNTKHILSILVPMSVLVIILSSYLSVKISTPLSKLEDTISSVISYNHHAIVDLENNDIKNKKFEIHEVEKLRKFILNAMNDIQKANLVKSEFLMNMSHDFRTPASGILHMSRLIHHRMPDDYGLKKLQKMIVDSSEQLMTFLEDVLDYSRLGNDKLKVTSHHFDMIVLINELIGFMTAKAYENNTVITTYYPSENISYYGDRGVIQRIILNLLSNAIKFTQHGNVDVSVSTDVIDEKKWLLIKIADTGVGIDKTDHELIFEPFYRVEPADSSKFAGIGLGLSNANLMAKKIGGRISIKSEIGLGSSFTIYLPA